MSPVPVAMAAQATPDMSQYITRAEAQSETGRLVNEQREAFSVQRKAIVEPEWHWIAMANVLESGRVSNKSG